MKDKQSSRKRVRLDMFLQTRLSRTTTPQMHPKLHDAATTPEEEAKVMHTWEVFNLREVAICGLKPNQVFVVTKPQQRPKTLLKKPNLEITLFHMTVLTLHGF